MKKMFFVLLSTCYLCGFAFAQQRQQEMAQLSYCYGVYEAIKSPAEVQKSKNMINKAKDQAYSDLTNNEFYREGKKEGKLLTGKQKRACLYMTYGFLVVAEMASGQAKANPTEDFVYCLGYMEAASNGLSLLRDLCAERYGKGNPANQHAVDMCYLKGKKKALSESTAFAEAYQAGSVADPLQVVSCLTFLANQAQTSQSEIDRKVGQFVVQP